MLKNEKVWQFLDGLSDSEPTPGGGSAAALSGAMGAALVSMVARLTIENDKYVEVHKEMRNILKRSENLKIQLLNSIDSDAESFKTVMAAYHMPKEPENLKKKRSLAIQKALKKATIVPFGVASRSLHILELAEILSAKGLTSAISDVGVSALLAHASINGAIYNVKINITKIKDETFVNRIKTDISEILEIGTSFVKEIENNVNQKLNE